MTPVRRGEEEQAMDTMSYSESEMRRVRARGFPTGARRRAEGDLGR